MMGAVVHLSPDLYAGLLAERTVEEVICLKGIPFF